MAPVVLTWANEGYDPQTGSYENVLTIRNVSDTAIGRDWAIYFSQLPRRIMGVRSDQVNIEQVNANYYKVSPSGRYEELRPGGSLIVKYAVSEDVPGVSHQPEGFYWITFVGGKEMPPVALPLSVIPLSDEELMSRCNPAEVYGKNRRLDWENVGRGPADVLPSVKQVTVGEGELDCPCQVALFPDSGLEPEAALLEEKLREWHGIRVSGSAPVAVRLSLSPLAAESGKEGYRLDISSGGIAVESATSHGVFNGIQTLLSLLKGQVPPAKLPCQTIVDYPDLAYRGFMIDIARNFIPVERLKKLVDLLASYKLNVMHFHFADDEGWRLEIPGLEELTEVSSRRGHTRDEASCLFPGYDGHYDAEGATSGNGYYTRSQFIALLKYAAGRHVQVIPEIESPGHARAAIAAMKARYGKYAATDRKKAEEYLLSDAGDSSVYRSAQHYTDNVMNVAMPSVYRFMEKVVSEIHKMYEEAGVTLSVIHVGGDEVPDGAWLGSPVCQRFMQEHCLSTAHQLFEYFYCRLSALLEKKGLKLGGWQEVALRNSPATDAALLPVAGAVYCWNAVAEWGEDEIPYRIANKGYPVVLCNVTNFYMDLAYSSDYHEPGLSWGGYVDEEKSFSALPYSIYRSSRTNMAGEPTDLDRLEEGKEKLRPECVRNIIGVQAQLFSETIRGCSDAERLLFPKILGLAERGWNACPKWAALHGDEERKAYLEDLTRFHSLIGRKEMPFWSKEDVCFHLPAPGLCVKGGKLFANASVRDAEIRYTTDGTEPSRESALWKSPVGCGKGVVKACLFYLGRRSVTATLVVEAE